MYYDRIKQINDKHKKELEYLIWIRKQNKSLEKLYKASYTYRFIKENDKLYLSNSVSNIDIPIDTINDLLTFYKSGYSYISNMSMLKNVVLKLEITSRITSFILSYTKNLNITHIIYEKVDNLDTYKAKLSLTGGTIISKTYNDFLCVVTRNNKIYIVTDCDTTMTDNAKDYLDNIDKSIEKVGLENIDIIYC